MSCTSESRRLSTSDNIRTCQLRGLSVTHIQYSHIRRRTKRLDLASQRVIIEGRWHFQFHFVHRQRYKWCIKCISMPSSWTGHAFIPCPSQRSMYEKKLFRALAPSSTKNSNFLRFSSNFYLRIHSLSWPNLTRTRAARC